MRILFTLACAILSSTAIAGSDSKQCSLSLEEARGIVFLDISHAKATYNECVTRIPELFSEITRDYEDWRKNEHELIAKSTEKLSELALKDPNFGNFDERVSKLVSATLTSFYSTNDPNATQVKLTKLCREYFSALAAGMHRSRNKEAYDVFDNAAKDGQ